MRFGQCAFRSHQPGVGELEGVDGRAVDHAKMQIGRRGAGQRATHPHPLRPARPPPSYNGNKPRAHGRNPPPPFCIFLSPTPVSASLLESARRTRDREEEPRRRSQRPASLNPSPPGAVAAAPPPASAARPRGRSAPPDPLGPARGFFGGAANAVCCRVGPLVARAGVECCGREGSGAWAAVRWEIR